MNLNQICKKCKDLISGKPKWHTNLKRGNVLKCWFFSEYYNKWSMRNGTVEILKIDGDLVYFRFDSSKNVNINLISYFKENHTLNK